MTSKLNLNDLDRLTSELASFARSGIPMPEGLAQLQQSATSGNLKLLTADLAKSAAQGRPLSEGLVSSRVAVPATFAALVRCGEISGDMTGVLDFALEYGRRLRRYRASLSTVFVYPLLVLSLVIIIFSGIVMFVVPQFKDIYEQLNAILPPPTRRLIDVSDFLNSSGFIIILILFIISVYLLWAAVTERLPRWITVYLPGSRNLVSLSDTAIMSDFVGRLLGKGVPLPEVCRAASLVVNDPRMQKSLLKMAESADNGEMTGSQLSSDMPATAAWLYRQAEARGTLAETCDGIARYCESRFELLSRRTLSLLEPLFILAVSLMCAVCIVALYLPLFNLPKIVGQ